MIRKVDTYALFCRALLQLLVLAAVILVLTGCWNRKEVNDLAIVTAAGIDQKKDKVVLSTQILITKGGSGGGSQQLGAKSESGGGQSLIRTAEGLTIPEAMAKLQEQVPRRIFWGHTEVFIFGKEFAQKGVRSQIDFLGRHPQMRLRAYVFVSQGKAEKMLELLPPLERSSAETLRELANSRGLLRVTLKDLLEMLSGDAGTAAIPLVDKLPLQAGEKPLQTDPYIMGTAVFKEDKMAGRLNDKLSRGMLWLRNEVRTAIISFKPKQEKGLMSFDVLDAQTELVPEIKNGVWKITVKIKAKDDLIQNTTSLNMSNPKFIKIIEKQLDQDLENRIKATLLVLQKKIKADIVGFAEAFHKKYPKEWNRAKKRWDEIFPEVEVQIKADVKIERVGISTIPQGIPKEEVKQK